MDTIAVDWAEVPTAVLAGICECLPSEDVLNCRLVCTRWGYGVPIYCVSKPLKIVRLLLQPDGSVANADQLQRLVELFCCASTATLELGLDRRRCKQLYDSACSFLQRFRSLKSLTLHEVRELSTTLSFTNNAGMPPLTHVIMSNITLFASRLEALELSLQDSSSGSSQLKPILGLTALRSLQVHGPQLAAPQLGIILQLTGLTSLKFALATPSDVQFSELKCALHSLPTLSNLRLLAIGGNTLHINEMLAVTLPVMASLRDLSLSDTWPITSVTQISELTGLTALRVGGVVGHNGWEAISLLPNLASLHVQNTIQGHARAFASDAEVGDPGTGLMWLASCASVLTTLSLNVMPTMNANGLSSLSRVQRLTLCGVKGPSLNPEVILLELCHFKILKHFTSIDVVRLDDRSMNWLALAWPLLQTFHLQFPAFDVTQKGFTWFQNIPNIQSLCLLPDLKSTPLRIDPCDLPPSLTGLTLVTAGFKLRKLAHIVPARKSSMQDMLKMGSKKEDVPFPKMPNLKSMHLITDGMSTAFMSALLKTWQSLTHLNIEYRGKLGSEGIRALTKLLPGMQNLRHLSLSLHCTMFPQLSPTLFTLTSLHSLSMHTHPGARGFENCEWLFGVSALTGLHRLSMSGLKDKDKVIELVQSLPYCRISLS